MTQMTRLSFGATALNQTTPMQNRFQPSAAKPSLFPAQADAFVRLHSAKSTGQTLTPNLTAPLFSAKAMPSMRMQAPQAKRDMSLKFGFRHSADSDDESVSGEMMEMGAQTVQHEIDMARTRRGELQAEQTETQADLSSERSKITTADARLKEIEDEKKKAEKDQDLKKQALLEDEERALIGKKEIAEAAITVLQEEHRSTQTQIDNITATLARLGAQ